MHLFSQFLMNIKATTAIEYSLIMAGVALGISAAVFVFGDDMFGIYEGLSVILVTR